MAATAEVQLEDSWKKALQAEFEATYMKSLKAFLLKEKRAKKVIFPKGEDMFAALNLTPLPKVRVVILGQDPYHGPGQAHGLCFSVLPGVAPPPSLVNIAQEINMDLGEGDRRMRPDQGCLSGWATQGVLLLNSVLTVEQSKAASHRGQGWETFTDRIVSVINDECEHVVFLLWGSYAQKKGSIVDTRRHCVLTAPHPSPLSAHRGFFGCRHFSKTNEYLEAQGRQPIDWFALD